MATTGEKIDFPEYAEQPHWLWQVYCTNVVDQVFKMDKMKAPVLVSH